MPKGHWSFLHEWSIYDYLLARVQEKTLRIKKVISKGKIIGRSVWIKVEEIKPIVGTTFPDIQAIKLKGENQHRCAEVKFTTSLFNYHYDKIYELKFIEFVKQNGFILVASHDYLPTNGLLNLHHEIDVFEIELEDFITFCRENFSRLLNRQIKAHTSTRVWLMYQGPNFNVGFENIKPARESMIWCPTENLTGFDLAPGDRVLFYKTSGVDRIKVQNEFLKDNIVNEKWKLREIYIAEVTSKIYSRSEFHQLKKHKEEKALWANDPLINTGRRWNRVFKFKKVKVITADIQMRDLHQNPQSFSFFLKAFDSFCYGRSRELPLQSYRDLLEALT